MGGCLGAAVRKERPAALPLVLLADRVGRPGEGRQAAQEARLVPRDHGIGRWPFQPVAL